MINFLFLFSLPDRILKESSKVFEDVLESFYSIDCIKSQFEAWRSKYFASYKDAYIGLCLPKLFNPLIRLQLLTWTPLEVSSSASSSSTLPATWWFFHTCAEQSKLHLWCVLLLKVCSRDEVSNGHLSWGKAFLGTAWTGWSSYVPSRLEFNLAHCQFLLREWCTPKGL